TRQKKEQTKLKCAAASSALKNEEKRLNDKLPEPADDQELASALKELKAKMLAQFTRKLQLEVLNCRVPLVRGDQGGATLQPDYTPIQKLLADAANDSLIK